MVYLKRVAPLLLVTLLPAIAHTATIGGTDYATQYDYSEFFAATDGKKFRVVLAGNPFPGVNQRAVAISLLAQMQAARPQPHLAFTYDDSFERPRPDYRLVLLFDASKDFGAMAVCAGTQPRLGNGKPGLFNVFAVYCRNDLALSQTTAWTNAAGPDDPRVEQLFRELFAVLFSDAAGLRPRSGAGLR
ncbi:MAG: hypothetical protein J0J01_12945 [Reyranella sp.]|uniref:hypothetical protein n=1 Tax=Reyranella sp. TaxID=1929291 RepID=UPI001ACE595B|nr:hypothetical protein [Reyranella sp.]MBN9087810.1 hypothetical protein [Reyranella sp.]